MWELRIQHDGLVATRVLRGHTQADVDSKARIQTDLWNERWSALQQAASTQAALLTRQRVAIHGQALALLLTIEASARLVELNSLLQNSLALGTFFHPDLLKDTSLFSDPPIGPPLIRSSPPPPLQDRHRAQLGLIDKLIPSRSEHKRSSAAETYATSLAAWTERCRETEVFNLRNAHDAQNRARRHAARKARFYSAQLAQHQSVETLKRSLLQHDPDAVEYFFAEVLSRSPYPIGFPSEATLQYAPSTRFLLVDYELPSVASWPTSREIQYIPRRRTLQQIPVSDLWTRKSYDDALHQTSLRVLSELFAHDDARALHRVAFNGWVRSLDQATGNIVHQCVMSVLVKRDTFTAINLANVHAKSCFKNLNGVASHRMTQPTAIHPIAFSDPIANHFERSDTARWDPHEPRTNLIAINR